MNVVGTREVVMRVDEYGAEFAVFLDLDGVVGCDASAVLVDEVAVLVDHPAAPPVVAAVCVPLQLVE